ncbi:MAG: flagellar biosynthesis protein FlhF [Chitinispirillaceae bacterium]|nr:flagellar biosynthesis protein FlhF [Chitinispirillaceae bacterium]
MRIKKFTAGSMREALLQIKSDLGEEAIILKTRKLPKKVFSLGPHDEIEVTAAVDETAAGQPALPPITMKSTGVYERPRPAAAPIIESTPSEAPEAAPPESPRAVESDDGRRAKDQRRSDDRRDRLELLDLREDIRELRAMVKGIIENGGAAAAGGFTGGWAILYKRLIDSEVKPDVAEELLKRVGTGDIMLSDSQAEKQFTAALASSFPVSGPLKLKKEGPLVVAFIGPTGHGKTTTLAKLAAHCRIVKKKRVSILTADTYRIAAIEQIRIFTEIIKVGLQVVFTPEEASVAIAECEADDIVLVDTAGRSQRNREHMEDLEELLTILHADEVHLVLSATTKDSDLVDCIERYRPSGINRLLFTKLDETRRIGNILNTVHRCDLPVSYFTTGQSVPDDIEVAQASRFIQRLLEGCTL